MSPWPETPWNDRLMLNHFERDLTTYAREVRDLGFSSPSEARLKLMAMVSLCSEHLARIERHESVRLDRIARDEREVSVPPVGA